MGVAVLLAAGLTISLVSNVLQKPQTAAEWVDDHMHDEEAQGAVTGETTSTVELYWDLEQMNSVAPTMMDMTPEDFLLGLGLSFESQPTLLAVE